MAYPLKSALLAVALLTALPALAADGYVNGYVNLRAGPDTRYPRIMTLRPGTAIAVYGCLDNWSWCDVGTQGERGWIAGDFVQYPYNNQRVVLSTYGARIGIPIVSFVLNAYWGDHYSNRSWYGERQRWEQPGRGYRQPRPGYRPQPNDRTRPHYPPRRQDNQHPQPGGPDHGHGPQGGGPGHGGKGSPQGQGHGKGHGGHQPPDGKGGGGGGGGGGD
ncbi:MAG: SH3 domain-containing protein [Xanthomonadaceae bacterium]|nr:SH3 domain-containing protein [Xanthomonadaceae bacterium]